jgi:hypothetical protein
MGKSWGVVGGFLLGSLVVTICIGIIMYMALEMEPSGSVVILLGLGYFAGWIMSIYLGYGFSYDTGLADCKLYNS